MTNYIIRRLLLMPLTLFGVTFLIFAMIYFGLSPEERSALYVRDIPKNEATMAGVIKRYGLDDPLLVQYWHWLVGRKDTQTGEIVGGILRGDLGYSRSQSQPVNDLLLRRFPATVELALYTILPVIVIGVWLGIVAAVNHNKFIDQAARVFAILGHSLPSFVVGLLVLMIFYARLQWFPPGRLSDWANAIVINPETFRTFTRLITIDALLNGRVDIFLDALRHLVLPVTTLSTISWAVYVRVTRSSMLETLRQEYVVTARAKGLKENTVIHGHARPNALIPVVTLAGGTIAGLLSGAVFTETIFNYPGIGQAAGQAAITLDVVAVLSFTLLSGLILLAANLLVDVLYGFVDPRVRLS
jgi:peptide/nickel transport system permease protein